MSLSVGIGLILVLFFVSFLTLMEMRFPPEWKDDYEQAELARQNELVASSNKKLKPWTILQIRSAVFGMILPLSFAVPLAVTNKSFSPTVIAFIFSLGILGWGFFQSANTDVRVRLVDGRSQYLIAITSFAVNAWALLDSFPKVWAMPGSIVVNIMSFLALAIIGLRFVIPSWIMGAADFRALLVLFVTVFPLTTLTGLGLSLALSLVVIIIFGIVGALKVSKNSFESFFKAFLTNKQSVPVVPVLMGPGLFIVILSPTFLNLFN